MTIHLLVTSPRVPVGLLSRSAWDVLATADARWCRDAGSATAQALEVAGLPCEPQQGAPREVAAALVEASGRGREVVWVGSDDADPGLTDALATELDRRARQGEEAPEVEMVVGSWDGPGMRLLDAVAVMDRLRGPGGCPWDAEQTHASLTRYLLEEAHEAVEALESGDDEHAAEELGDVLLQVLFHARVAQERRDRRAVGVHESGPAGGEEAGDGSTGLRGYDIDDVAGGLVDKLVRRHPHVFASDSDDPHASATEAGQVEANWEQIKAAEKVARRTRADEVRGPLDGIPTAMPTLARAGKMAGRLDRHDLLAEAAASLTGEPADDSESDEALAVGARLWEVVVAAQRSGVDADQALRAVLRRLQSAHS